MERTEKFNIIIVDDNRCTLSLLGYWFRSSGHDVRCASSGENALRLLEKRSCTVLITDLQMPGINGLDLARKARQMERDMVILLCTGCYVPGLLGSARDAGVTAVLKKPLNMADMVSLIEEELQKKGEYPGRQWTYWTCPVCSTPHQGWSPINACSCCGYRE